MTYLWLISASSKHWVYPNHLTNNREHINICIYADSDFKTVFERDSVHFFLICLWFSIIEYLFWIFAEAWYFNISKFPTWSNLPLVWAVFFSLPSFTGLIIHPLFYTSYIFLTYFLGLFYRRPQLFLVCIFFSY